MSFSRAHRDEYHLTGSDNAAAPDYVKGPPSRVQRDAARAAREAGQSVSRSQPLPKVPLKVEKPRYRTSTIAKELFSGEAAVIIGGYSSKAGDHPLSKFERPVPIKPTGRFRADDGELAKITSIPYNREDAMQERRVAVKGSRASQEANQGLGYGLISQGA
eukprot:gb/GFBE01043708.1/.p1 GENE.gb/GFBE01043708.1/~~gb/GFBE01043708.1/.p1  ORF type:complete len:161 (+),score=29.71 gb/GFBE01043708.1/:1-483(+)